MRALSSLEKIRRFVQLEFPGFGLHKTATVVRLLFEISRSGNEDVTNLIPECLRETRDFFQVKNFLLAKRYPSLSKEDLVCLPPVVPLKFFEQEIVVNGQPGPAFPRRVFFEKETAGSPFLSELKDRLSGVPFEEISSYKNFLFQNTIGARKHFSLLKKNMIFFSIALAQNMPGPVFIIL